MAEFSHQMEALPDPNEPPKTTLHVLRSGQREQAWQRFLFYFLSSEEPHGLDTALLEHVLSSLSEQKYLDLSFSYFDIEDIRVETEVTLSNEGRADAVIWLPDTWIICWELKLYSSEGQGQTEAYVAADSFETLDLEKNDFEDCHYLYLARKNASPPSADEFVSITWEWIASEIQSFLQNSYGQYPARTTAQLEDFIATIHHELTMTQFKEYEQEKTRLYFEYYDEIAEAKQAFENSWDEFVDDWGLQLAQELGECDMVEIPDLPESFVVLDCENSSDELQRWIFIQGNAEYAAIRKHGWQRDKDDLSEIYYSVEGCEEVRFSLCHRPEPNRELAIREHTLELQLWHKPGLSDEFMDVFRHEIRSKAKEAETSLPSSVSMKGGRRSNPLTATYNIPVGEYDDFFDAYVAALGNAFRDLVIDNHDFIRIIDESFEEALEVF